MTVVDPFRPAADGSVLDLPEAIQQRLESFVRTQASRLSGLGDGISPLLDSALDFVAGGKRLRAAYCYWGWRAAGGGTSEPAIVTAAASLEWLQAGALVHDDLMDGSDSRRGKPAAHRGFERLHRDARWRGDAARFGAGSAILLGDLLLTWADEMYRTCGLPDDAVARAGPYFDACKSEVTGGQFLDLVAQFSGADVDEAMRVVRFKAAGYTVERPLHIGAALAGADPELIRALTDFGVPVGEAFQLRDDILGVFGDPEVTGKPAGDDLREGKQTVLVAHARAAATTAQRICLDGCIGDPDLDPGQVEELRAIICDTGALDTVEQQIQDLERSAVTALAATPASDESARDALQALAHLSTRRSR